MIRCFFDDSGKESDQGNPIVCIAGYMAIGDDWWTMLSNAWAHQLFRHSLAWIHMKDFIPGYGEYAALGWDWPKRKAVIQDFIRIIKQTQIIGFGVAVDAEAWRKLPKELTKVEGTAQEFCFTRIIRMIVDRLKVSRPDDSVTLCYDCDEQFTPARFARFIKLRKHRHDVNKFFRAFSIADPKSFIPLQAADILAWETRKEFMRQIGGYESRPEWKFLFEATSIFDVHDYAGGEFWTADELQEKILKPWEAAQKAGKAWTVNGQ